MPGVVVPAMREKKDPLESIMRGLQIASSIYGIKSNMDQAERQEKADAQAEEDRASAKKKEDDIARGVMTPMQRAAMAKDFEEVDGGTPGAIPAFVRDAKTGQETPLFLKARGKDVKPTGPKTEKVGDTLVQLDEATGKWKPVYSAPAKAAPPPKDITVAERNTLQTQYDRDLGTRKNRMVLEAYDDATSLVKDPSPASDQALIFAYMKSLDPNSVVRESEAESAQALGGMMERAKAWYAKNAGESGLTDAQRKDLVSQIRKLADAAAKRQDGVDKQFTDLAGRRGVDTRDLRFIGRPVIGDDPKAPEKIAQQPAAAANTTEFKGRRQKSPKDGQWYVEVAPDVWQPDPSPPSATVNKMLETKGGAPSSALVRP
jgi:hypothetical protein